MTHEVIGLGERDIPEIVAALAAFIADPEPYVIKSDPPLDLRAIAAEIQLLPAFLDWGGCFGLRPSGEVVSFPWDEPRQLRADWAERIQNMVYYQASLKYPALAVLVPRRPRDAVNCSLCGGSGRCMELSETLGDQFVCYCGGLGWLPSETA